MVWYELNPDRGHSNAGDGIVADHPVEHAREALDIEAVVFEDVGPVRLGGPGQSRVVTMAIQLLQDRSEPLGDSAMGIHVWRNNADENRVVDQSIAFFAVQTRLLSGALGLRERYSVLWLSHRCLSLL